MHDHRLGRRAAVGLGVMLLAAGLLAGGCDRDSNSGGSSSSGGAGADAASVARGGMIAGTGKTQDGRPLESFEVEYSGHVTGKLTGYDANGNLLAGADGTVEGKNGKYEIKVPDGQYTTRASIKVKWKDRPFHFRLEPEDGEKEGKRVEVTSSNGFTRNYVWKLSGPKPGVDIKAEGSTYASNFYGGVIKLNTHTSERRGNNVDQGLYYNDADAVVEYTLTPKGKLIDGSEGKPVVERVPVIFSGRYTGVIRGVPIGDYTMTAKIISPKKGDRPAKLTLKDVITSPDYKNATYEWHDSVDIVFDQPYDGVLRDWGARPVNVYVGG